MEVFVKEQVVAEVGIPLQAFIAPEYRTPTIPIEQEQPAKPH
jgi:hypothetical protein